MKKLLAVLAMVMFCGTAFAYDYAATGSCVDVSTSEYLLQCTYSSASATPELGAGQVATGANKVIRLTMPSAFGNIRQSYFQSSSLDCNYWVSESDAEAATSVETILYVTGVNLGGGVDPSNPIPYSNKDTVMGDYLYLTINNDSATATGTWKYTVIVDKYGLTQ